MRRLQRHGCTVAATLILSAMATTGALASDAGGKDDWAAFRPFVGQWEGVANGLGGTSDVTHEWSFVIDGHFLRLRTRSVVRGEDGPLDVHEDVAYLSHDTDHDVFVFRQFLSEGYVNTYEVRIDPGDPGAYTFAYREGESAGGMRAQLRFRFAPDGGYDAALDLAASAEGEFHPCQEMEMHRVR
jgi:hypothetical protein